jgi:hypothetical protein
MNQPHDELRGRFRSLRDDERAGAPPFRETWDVASRRTPVTARWRVTPVLTLTAAAGVVLAVGLVLRSVRDRDSARLLADSTVHAPDAVPSITTWTSPTGGLLRTSGSDLLGSPPALHASILDRVAPAPVQPRGTTP